MAIAWQSVSTDFTANNSDTSLDPAVPSGLQAGELMVAFGECVNGRTIATPTANGTWTQRVSDTNGSVQQYMWTKIATTGDLASLGSFGLSGGFAAANVSVHRVTGAGTNAPTTATGTGTNSQTQTCPDVNAPSAGCLVFWMCCNATFTSATANKGSERCDIGGTDGGWQAVYTNVESSSGTIGGATITTLGFGAKRLMSASFEAAGGGGSIIPQAAYHLSQMGA